MWRRVLGIATLEMETEGTVEDAHQSWQALLEQMTEDCPPLYAFVRPEEVSPPTCDGLSQRQCLVGAAIEYIEMEAHDGIVLATSQRERLERVLRGDPLPLGHPVRGCLVIPADPPDRQQEASGSAADDGRPAASS